MKRMRTDQARNEFGAVVNQVAYGGRRIVLERRGKAMAAIIPMEDLALLERLIAEEEDRIDIAAAEAALAEGGEPRLLDDFMKELGIGAKARIPRKGRPARPKKAAQS